jgi:signal transduction histidine kinase
MPASREFMVICQAQLSLLVESLGVSSAIVYLTESWEDGATPRLQSVASVPIEGVDQTLQLSPSIPKSSPKNDLEPHVSLDPQNRSASDMAKSIHREKSHEKVSKPLSPSLTPVESESHQTANHQTASHQLVLPLLQDDRVLGVLVAERNRPWDALAQPQVDAIRQALTAACLLDQRSQWFEEQSLQQQIFQRQQKDLFDNLLHQFRNPLTAMRTFGKLLVKRLTESDRNREAAGSIVRESDRLQALLVQFEEAIDAGVIIPEPPKALQDGYSSSDNETSPNADRQPLTLLAPATLGRSLSIVKLDLQSILQPALQSASGVMDDRQQQLHLDIPLHSVFVLADPIALAEVITNLLDNASKYTPSQGHIQVKLWETPDQIDLWITDTGYGIPPEDLAHLFERHYRGVQAQSTIPGTGLGLCIARELTRQMKGDIQIFSPPSRDMAWLSENQDNQNRDNLSCRGTSIQVTLPKA